MQAPKKLDIYLMGIGGTGMGAFAGLLKELGHNVRGSDMSVYSPMKEKLSEWGINYKTPYDAKNLSGSPDLVIVGNVIRKDNVEVLEMLKRDIPYDSFPCALKKFFLRDSTPIVITGTHGKTTSSALIAHTLISAGRSPGFLIGGALKNYPESFRLGAKDHPFVVEGDEYDTAFFDKGPKFMHYQPKFLLATSLEYDHADIYPHVDDIVLAFAKLFSSMKEDSLIVINASKKNLEKARILSKTMAKILTYGDDGNFTAKDLILDSTGIKFSVHLDDKPLGQVCLPLFGEHNVENALGCYALLYTFGLKHEDIFVGFKSFLGVARRMEEVFNDEKIIAIDDFAHHPTAVRETIKACRQKYPMREIWAIFEPRSATACKKIFEDDFSKALDIADRIFLTPLGRKLDKKEELDTYAIAKAINKTHVKAKAYDAYEDLISDLQESDTRRVHLFMSNGDFMGHKLRLWQK